MTNESETETHTDPHGFRERVAHEHQERLTGYRALLARLELAAAEVQMEADEASGTPNTASQFTDDLRYLIALSEEIVSKFRPHREGEHPLTSHDTSN